MGTIVYGLALVFFILAGSAGRNVNLPEPVAVSAPAAPVSALDSHRADFARLVDESKLALLKRRLSQPEAGSMLPETRARLMPNLGYALRFGGLQS
ncbi:MAG: hypothetical protein GY871_03995 [Actinomycetales bacterium]|nr:hypothetical protein [Actinomycetales bacterium]